MSQELSRRKYRKEIPEKHRQSMDTRLVWLWNQRFGTVQQIYSHSPDLLDRTSATMILQCIIGEDLESIKHLFYRLEGGPQLDQEVAETSQPMRI